MAVLKKFRSRWWSQAEVPYDSEKKPKAVTPAWGMRYDVRPLTISQLDECWRLDQRCFIDGEAYSRETFEADIAYVALHDEAAGQIEFAYYYEAGAQRAEPPMRFDASFPTSSAIDGVADASAW